jgi:glycosyltransferase involved in cell wall biosynthesis
MDQLKTQFGLKDLVLMYIGNLEQYQGIDLMLESFALLLREHPEADLVIIGGHSTDIQKYQEKCSRLKIADNVHFLGPRPIGQLAQFLAAADVLVSPRSKGVNTPMKLYSYLHSGKPILATDLPTHTQILDSHVAMLAEPSPVPFGQAMLRLARDRDLRTALGSAGRKLVEENFTYGAYREKLGNLLQWIETEGIRNGKKPSA